MGACMPAAKTPTSNWPCAPDLPECGRCPCPSSNPMSTDQPDSPPEGARTVRCPACGGPSLYHPSNGYRPFCSERCKNLDFGAWASETFRMPTEGGGTEVVYLKPGGPLDCSDGQVLHDWCLSGYGIAWRSTWEVEAEIRAGQLVAVLEDFAAPPNGIYVVFPQRKHLPLRVRLWIEYLKQHYSQSGFWQRTAG